MGVKSLAFGLLVSLGLATAAAPAFAQAAGCGDVQPMLLQRKTIADSLNAGGKKKIDAKFACNRFGALVANGSNLIKWVETNKDWCQIPDAFLSGIKTDHQKAVTIRGQACGMAAKQVQMEKQARENGGRSGGLLGGGGLSGDMRMPQGAL